MTRCHEKNSDKHNDEDSSASLGMTSDHSFPKRL